jgi:hypothetical protein
MDLLAKHDEAESVNLNLKVEFCKSSPKFDSISEVQYGCTMTHVVVGRYIVLTSVPDQYHTETKPDCSSKQL